MISAATHAIDFENSTIEDGDGRFVIAGVAGVLFLVCLYFMVSSLATARWTKLMSEAIDADQISGDGSARTGPRVEVASVSTLLTPRPSSLPISARLKPTLPTEADSVGSPGSGNSGQGRSLFGATPDATKPRSVSGLFGTAPPSEPEPIAPEPQPEQPAPVAPEPQPEQPAPVALRDYHPSDAVGVDSQSEQASATVAGDDLVTAEDIRALLFAGPMTPETQPTDELPQWQVVILPDNADDPAEQNADDDEPPSTGYLYATGG